MIRLGLDWGRARIGVAVSDELGLMAHPVARVPFLSAEQVVEEIIRLCRERGASEIVVGLPLNMDGSEGESARSVRDWAAKIGSAAALPVVLWDERLTSWEADRRLREKGTSPLKKKEKR
ncbi:MAG TPA: Holliday junction resolvase RuvX, partial [Elusimicrobiota bacterium]|nr:Holliday junction resolvase RuvX [Elusimicrobiota bacterium]